MMEELLNLDNLSQEEKDKILGVLQKDEMVRQAEDKKIWWVWFKCYVIHELDSAMCMNELMGDLLSVSAVRFLCPFKISWKLWYFEKSEIEFVWFLSLVLSNNPENGLQQSFLGLLFLLLYLKILSVDRVRPNSVHIKTFTYA